MKRRSRLLSAYNRLPATLHDATLQAWTLRLEIDRRIAQLEALRNYLDAQFAGEMIISNMEEADID
jgi:hypothetical protein